MSTDDIRAPEISHGGEAAIPALDATSSPASQPIMAASRPGSPFASPGIDEQLRPASAHRPDPEVPSQATVKDSSTFYRSCEISLMEPVGSMSISPANRDVVLAARKGLFILDLDDPYVPPRFLAHMTTWEAVDIQWNPHPARSNWVASTSNQKLLVWNLDRPSDPRAAPMATNRLPVYSSYPPMASSSPLTSRISAHQTVFGAPSQNSGTAASTGLGQLSTNSPFAHTMANSSIVSNSGLIAAPRSSAIEHILHAHSRAITDINWSAFHPEVLASSSMDTWTWVWDLRMSGAGDGGRRKPAQGYSAWNAAVTQVKFNRASEHRLASTCDNKVLIWDDRKGSLPLATIEAHESKIYSIDWSRDTSLGLDRLLTCSLDRTVKFWDLSSESAQNAIGRRELITEAESVIETKTPVWRARHLPFGNGVMTLPQRGDTALSMWAKDRPDAPMAKFEGHTDIVKEYLFRVKGGQNRDCDDRRFQLITWSKDQTLRLWPVSEEQTRSVGHKPGAPIRVLNTRAFAKDITYSREAPIFSDMLGESRALDAKEDESASSVTMSSILPPEKATRALLSGKGGVGGSSSRVNGPSPYGSSISAFQSVVRDGRTSPVAAFSSSFGQRPLDRRIYHSSSQSSLRGDPAAIRRQAETLPRSLGRTDINGRRNSTALPVGSLPRSILVGSPSAAFNDPSQSAFKFGTSYRSTKLAASNKSGSSFKLPVGLREGAVTKIPAGSSARRSRHGRSYAIQEEDEHLQSKAKSKGKERDNDNHGLKDVSAGAGRRKKPSRRALGAPMRLDRARLAGPAVDPIGWIANVRIQNNSGGEDSKPVSDDNGQGRASALNMSRQASGMGTGASVGETDREDGLSSQRLGDEIVALSRKLPRILFEKVEVAQKTCTLSMYGPWADREPAFLRITIVFPTAYPRMAPTFDLERSANITLKTRAYLLRGLARLAKQAADVEKPCIELCCRFLLGEPVELLDDDDGDGGNASHKALSAGSITDSDDEGGPIRPRMKMPARRMGASFGPHGELVVFGVRTSASGSAAASRSTSRAQEKDLRSSSTTASRSRSKSRVRGATREPPRRMPAELEESRFLRSYTALSSAMSSLARYSNQGSGGGAGHGLRDSDVVQLMSSDFFARRLLSRGGTRRGSNDRSSSGEDRRPSLAGLTPLTAVSSEREQGSDNAPGGAPLQAVDRLYERHHAHEVGSSVVRIYFPFVGSAREAPSSSTYVNTVPPAGTGKKPPPFLRKRSNSLPSSPNSPHTPSPLNEAGWQGGGHHRDHRHHHHHQQHHYRPGGSGSSTPRSPAATAAVAAGRRSTRFANLGSARDDLHLL